MKQCASPKKPPPSSRGSTSVLFPPLRLCLRGYGSLLRCYLQYFNATVSSRCTFSVRAFLQFDQLPDSVLRQPVLSPCASRRWLFHENPVSMLFIERPGISYVTPPSLLQNAFVVVIVISVTC